MDDTAIADAMYLARRAYGDGGMAPGYTPQTAPSDIAPIYQYLSPDPKAEYGTLLPFARDRETGEKRWAMPSALREGALGILDLLAGTKTGELTGRAAESITLGGLGAGAALAPRGALAAGAARPIKAYHGSPHDFDRFDLSKIGTGEGAQAYGHGLYFAENEAVAKGYRDALAPPSIRYFDGSRLLGGAEENAAQILLDRKSTEAALRYVDSLRGSNLSDPKWLDQTAAAIRTLDSRSVRAGDIGPQGRMYEVAIHADPQRFLDWDKPLVGQHPAALDLAARVGVYPDETGGQLIRSAATNANMIGGSGPLTAEALRIGQENTSRALRESGVPGIKYLDQGSRGAGDGSRNFVTFDDSIIEILRKYGLMAPAPVGVPDRPVESQAYAGGGVVDRALALVM